MGKEGTYLKKNILLRTNALVCLIIIIGFLLTAVLSYRANYSASMENIEQVSALTSEGIYYQMSGTFTKPVNISLTMANDSLLRECLLRESGRLNDTAYTETIRDYLSSYRDKYGYDSVFLVSDATGRYYNYDGLDRVLTRGNPENQWYYALAENDEEYTVVVDNDEVRGAQNEITVFVNCKIRDDHGQILGVVGVGLRVSHLQSLLQGYQNEFGVGACLIDGQGTIEISSTHTGYEAVNLFDAGRYGEDVRAQILSWNGTEEARSFWVPAHGGQGQNYVVTRYLPELDWRLVVEQDTGAKMTALNRQLMLTVVVILLIIGVILYVITHVIRSFNRQIVTLAHSIEQERRSVFVEATEQLFDNIYELDITNNRPANRATEEYFESLGAPPGTPYDKALQIVAQKQIKEEFRRGYVETFRTESVLRAYEEGRDTLRYEFMISTGGEYYWMRITARIMRWESDGSLHMLTYRQNINAEKLREQRMRTLAQTDEMTHFLTKSATQQHVDLMLRAQPCRSYALFIFDIDNFKTANDRFGHAFGDTVIADFTDVIRAQFREDDLLGRIGGDEFLVFVPAPDPHWAEGKAALLSASLDRTHTEGDKSWHMSASIGVSFAPRDGTDYETLYQKADRALYQTKRRGKNGFTLYDERQAGS